MQKEFPSEKTDLFPDGIRFFCFLSGKSCDFPDGSHFYNLSSGNLRDFPDGEVYRLVVMRITPLAPRVP